MVDLERGRLSIRATAVLVTAAVGLCWFLYQRMDGERSDRHAEMSLFRAELAEIGDGLDRQAVEAKAMRELFDQRLEALSDYVKLQLDFMVRDVAQQREHLLRLEAAQAQAMRELREDLKTSRAAKGTPDDE